MSLSIDSVTVRYEGAGRTPAVAAVTDVTLELAAGEVVALVGPSGSGKSTLLRAVAGLEPLSSGVVSVNGRDLTGTPAHARGIGMMFQDNALFAHRSVAANVGYGLEIAGWKPRDQQRRVAELLELVGMSGFEDRAVDQLSGGESQRVALARSLAPRPSVLLLDEPLGSLDRLLRDQLVEDLSQLLREVEQTALYVTHDQDEAFALADRIAVLSAGRLRQVGRPDELWRNPRSGFVARFLGHPNVWPVAELGAHPLAAALTNVGRDDQMDGRPERPFVLVPVSAVALSPLPSSPLSGPSAGAETRATATLTATVLSCRFDQGVYEVAVDPEGMGVERLVARHSEPLVVGSTVEASIDVDAAVALADHDESAITDAA